MLVPFEGAFASLLQMNCEKYESRMDDNHLRKYTEVKIIDFMG